MRAKKIFAAIGVVCVSLVLATSVFAQEDLDNLLNDLEGDAPKKAEAKPAEAKPAAPAPAPEAKPAEEKPAAPAPAVEAKTVQSEVDVLAQIPEVPKPAAEEKPAAPLPVAEAKPAEEKPAEPLPVVEAKPEEKKPAPSESDVLALIPEAPQAPAAPAPAPEAKEEKPAEPLPVVETKPAEEKPAEPLPVVEAKPAEKKPEPSESDVLALIPEAPQAPAAPAPAPEAKEEKPAAPLPVVAAEEKPAEPLPVVEAKPAEAKPAEPLSIPGLESKPEEVTPEAALLSDIKATEQLRRDARRMHAQNELQEARAALERHDWDVAFTKYSLANESFKLDAEYADLCKECEQGMGKAKYEAAKQALKESNRELAAQYAEEALKLRNPYAGALLDGLKAEQTKVVVTDVSEIEHRRNNAEYKKDRDLINKRLRLSSQYLAVADLNSALEQCDLVLRSDPYNQQAIALRARIQRKRQMIIDKEREATRNGMIADVGAAWRPVYAVDSVEFKNIDGGTMKTPIGGDPERSIEQSIEKRMKEMMLPSISFRPPATIIDAVDFFRQASKDFDRPDIPIDQRGFNFILTLDKALTGGAAPAENNTESAFGATAEEDTSNGAVPQIPTISASNLSLWEAMQHVCKSVGFKFKVQGSVVMVMPKNVTTDELITRSYNVVESFVDRMNDASSGLKNEKAGDFGGGGGNDNADENPEDAWKKYFEEMGVSWPLNSRIKYIKAIGKLRVTNTADQLAILEQALNELNVTPMLIEIETRFVEVAQEDLNSLGFEWLLNSDYSFNMGGKLKKALNLKDGVFQTGRTTTQTTTTPVATGEVDPNNGGVAQTVSTTTTSEIIPVAGQWQRSLWAQQNGLLSDDPTSQNYYRNWANALPVYDKDGNITGYAQTRTGKNVGINAVDGTDFSSGMRYLSTQDNHISGKGASNNDQFMRVNAFLGNADLSMILHMLSQRSDTDLLSAPKVVTKSGQEATIKVVTIYRYPQDYDVTIQSTSSSSSSSITGGGSGSDGKILPMVEPQNFEQQEVGVILTCTPDVSAEGQMINLQLTPKVIGEPTWRDYGMKVPMSSVMSSTAQAMALASGNEDMQWFTVPMEQPFFKERSIDTHVSIYNGATIVMGGLITEERKSMEDKIPFLGDIPFIGRIFRSRSEWSNKRNLLIFVTARLVDPRGRQMTLGTGDDVGGSTDQPEAGVTPAPAN